MTLSPQLEARFEKLMKSYPPGRLRSALIPMLLYAQDETGAITPEVVDEISRRIGVTPLQIDEVVSYYSMLHRTPMGKHRVQICTNVACMLVGATELWDHACRRTGLGNKEVSADGRISLEEVECMGACSWAPAIQVNYDFHHHVTPEQLDRILEDLRDR